MCIAKLLQALVNISKLNTENRPCVKQHYIFSPWFSLFVGSLCGGSDRRHRGPESEEAASRSNFAGYSKQLDHIFLVIVFRLVACGPSLLPTFP